MKKGKTSTSKIKCSRKTQNNSTDRYLRAKTTAINDHPHIEEVELYWKSLWEEKMQHKQKTDWIKREEKENINSMNWMSIKTT
jgi:hypothetical protein